MIHEILSRARFPGEPVPLGDGNELSINIVGSRRRLLGGRAACAVEVLYYLRRPEVNFQKAADLVMARASAASGGRPVRVEASWLFYGNRVGIYLFEALATKENRRYRGMSNAICTMDQETGKTFFQIGSPANDALSSRCEYLLSRYEPGREAWLEAELSKLLAALMDRLRAL